jgi:hypothetical protein
LSLRLLYGLEWELNEEFGVIHDLLIGVLYKSCNLLLLEREVNEELGVIRDLFKGVLYKSCNLLLQFVFILIVFLLSYGINNSKNLKHSIITIKICI